ncbi:hypothetical protein HJP15_13845 [Pseudoalteromonas sp. NEC-BIFX-2020_002]|uniref:hypothetical protein n=1 Tax=Pseudoalteromonas sp. NEC-BIFX-2020_002 TaxID=2732353 RepID=UPI001476A6F2|nr:hypothetical protein [Pseudoalteromonas sp. NEC-BIFX-2020_002]NNG43991.1 hypothetical protein [Pseudoalteromonas sp. NEC-BIFX-2020_002]
MLKLTLLLLSPLLISFCIVLFFISNEKNLRKRVLFTLRLHPELGLMKQGLFWLSIITPILYFLTTGYLAWNGREVLLTAAGFNNFIEISILPVTLLSLSLPLSILVSRLHATEQTAEQIKITTYKNNIDTYRSHRQDLFSYFEQIGEVNYLSTINIKFKAHPRLYKNFFNGKPEHGLPIPNKDLFEYVRSNLQTARFGIDATLSSGNLNTAIDFYLNASSAIFRIAECLGVPEVYNDLAEKGVLVPVKIKEQPDLKSVLTAGTTTTEIVAAFRVLKSFYKNLCDFAGVDSNVIPPEHMKYIDSGMKYLTINDFPIIEQLQNRMIKDLIKTE